MEANNVIEIRPSVSIQQTAGEVMDKFIDLPKRNYKFNPFIEANTQQVDLSHLRNDCICPSFSADNEKTISHVEFIEAIHKTTKVMFKSQHVNPPEIRVSHLMSGRIPEAMNKPVIELLESEKTKFYERMAFIIQIPTFTNYAGGNELWLTIGGVRAYNKENLFGKKTYERFQLFIGMQNTVCCNLCISTDGLKDDLKVLNVKDLQDAIIQLIKTYEYTTHIKEMDKLYSTKISEKQFAQLIGKARLYQFLPKEEKTKHPVLQFNDSQFNAIAKDYYEDESFCRDSDGDINLWKVYNLFTSANKSSYIDSFLSRNVNALHLSSGMSNLFKGIDDKYKWFLN